MTSNLSEIYIDSNSSEANTEIFQINDIRLDILPTDVVSVGDNSVYEESYIRTKSVFAFRSKYAKSKIIVTLPISLNAYADMESGTKSSQDKGIQVLYQLSTRPYCFIKSQRIRSYLSSRAKISSTGFMLFAVDEINTVHDLRVPDVLFAEIHLMFCDHTSQVEDFKFSAGVQGGVDDPSLSIPFVNAFNDGFSDVSTDIKAAIKSAADATSTGGIYRDDATNLGSVIVMGPNVVGEVEYEEDAYQDELKRLKELGYYKEVIVTSPVGQDSLSDTFLRGSNTAPDNNDDEALKSSPKQHFFIYWTNFHDLSFGGASTMKSIKISRKNKLAPLFIGTHKYPFVQYMGKYPARVEISMDFNSQDIYDQNETSVVSAVGQLTNLLDYNNEFYPEISAYNTLKMASVSNAILGVESVVPSQTFVSASSAENGKESVTINFVEADVEEFMNTGVRFEGRPSTFDSDNTEVKVVTAYLRAIAASPDIRSTIESSANKDLHAKVTKYLGEAIESSKRELFGLANYEDVVEKNLIVSEEDQKAARNSIAARFNEEIGLADTKEQRELLIKQKEEALQNLEQALAGNKYAASVSAINTKAYNWPNDTYSDPYTQSYITILEQRGKLLKAGEARKDLSDEALKNSSVMMKYAMTAPDSEAIIIQPSEDLYSNRGATQSGIKAAYQAIVSLSQKGDDLAVSLLKSEGTTTEYLKKQLFNYAGTNLSDLPYPALTNADASPFYFLVAKPYFTAESLDSTYTTLSKDLDVKLEEVVTNKLELSDSSLLGKSGAFSLFSETGISVEEMYVVAESSDATIKNAAGAQVDASMYGQGSYTGTGFAGLNKAGTTAYDEYFLKYAQAHGVDAGLLKAIAHVESHFDPKARSGAGAAGLMQFIPATARRFNLTDRFNPEKSIEAAAKYLAVLSKYSYINGNPRLMLAGYNAGEGSVKKYNDVPPFKETKEYVEKVLHAYNTLYKASLSGAAKSTGSQPSYKADSDKAIINLSNAAKNTVNGTNTRNTDTVVDMSRYVKVKVDYVDDGDTVIATIDGKPRTIRIKGYDTPETVHEIKVYNAAGKQVSVSTLGQSFGATSKYTLESLIKQEGGYLLFEKKRETDIYNRDLSSVYLPSSNTNISQIMIQTGNATLYAAGNAGGVYINKLKELQEAAQRAGKGLWAPKFLDSQSPLEAKIAQKAIEDALKKTKSEADFLRVIKELGANISSTSPMKYDGKEVNSKDKPLGTKPVKAVPANTSVNLSSTNKDIHVKGHTANDVSSQWGLRNSSKTGFHAGIDSTGRTSRKDVIAAASGLATTSTMGGGGKYVEINHGNGFVTRYLHLANYSVANNTRVQAGTKIGTMGNTDSRAGTNTTSMPVHLHQETWVQPYGTSSLFNVNPWKTTSLKLLQGLDPKKVHADFKKYIDKNHLLSAHPDHAGKNVLTNARAKQLVFQGGGQGSTASVESVEAVTSGIVSAQGQQGDAYLAREAQVVAKRPIDSAASVFNEKGAAKIQMETMAYLQRYHLDLAFPAVKVYVVIGSETEDAASRKELKPNYYFEIDGIKDLALVCNNDENPVDFLSFSIANASFIRTDNIAVESKFMPRDLSNIGTSAEANFIADRVKLKPGAKLHIRAGYGNNPNNLKTIFNGVVTDVANEGSVTLNILAEGYGRELLMDAISPHKPTTPGGFFVNNSTPLIISEALGSREGIANFGNKVNFWAVAASVITTVIPGIETYAHDYTDPETKRLTTKYADISTFRVGNYRQRIFTNIYAAEIETLHQNYNSTWWNRISNLFSLTEQSGYFYIMHGQTPWAVLKEMEYRHPGTLAKPLMFQDRMTMFFGLKEQMYIARDLDSSYMKKIEIESDTEINADYIKHRPLRMDTVLGFHILSSETNIIMNNMSINSQFSTGVNVVYFEDKEDIVQKHEGDDMKEFKMKIDDSINAFEHRYKTIEMPGIHGKYSAFMYGTTELRKEAEKMYGGSIVMVGNPCVKAGDFAYISDNLRRINGLVKIRECKHYIDERRGFVTEITPGLYVEPSSFIYSALMLKLSFTARTAIATAALSNQIVSNDEADFKQYMEYFDSVKTFAKQKRGIGDISGWLKTAWNETGIVGPLVGMGITGLSAASLLRISTGVSRMSAAKLAATASGKQAKATYDLISAATKSMSWFKSASTAGIWNSARASFAAMGKSAGFLKSAASGLSAVSKTAFIPAWWSATRSLKAITTLGTVLLGSNPVGWLIAVAGQLAMSYAFAKVQEAELTRQPLMLFPVLSNGRPYVGGISGFNYNSYMEALYENAKKNFRDVAKAGEVLQATSNNSMLAAVGAFLNSVGGGDSYTQQQLQKKQGYSPEKY